MDSSDLPCAFGTVGTMSRWYAACGGPVVLGGVGECLGA